MYCRHPADGAQHHALQDQIVHAGKQSITIAAAIADVGDPAGETRTVALAITPDRLALWNIDNELVVEPGDFSVLTGPNLVDLQSVILSVR